MKRIITVPLLAALSAVLIPLGASANTQGTIFQVDVNLRSITGGPPPKAVSGRLVPVTLVYRNTGTKTITRLKASFTPAQIIARSKQRYTKAKGFYAPQLTASWLFANVKPGTAKTVVIWLKFPAPYSTAPVYTVALEARGLNTSAFVSKLFTLHYRLQAN